MTSRNDIALARNAAPAPNCASTSPARAGPNARAPVNCMPLRRTALTSASGGTSWGTNACHAAMVMPAPDRADHDAADDERRRRHAGHPDAPERERASP